MSRGGNSFAFYNAGGTCVSFTGGNPNPFLACNGDGARAVGGLGGGTLPTSIDNLLMGGGGGGGAVVRSNNVTLPSVFDGGLSGANFPLADTTITNRYGSGPGGGTAATTPLCPPPQHRAATACASCKPPSAPPRRWSLFHNGAGTSPTLGTAYQNSVTVNYQNPLRTAPTTQVSPGGTYTPGGPVPGSNYASASTTNEDVRVAGNTSISVTKNNGTTTLVAGQTTSYTIAVANPGPSNAPGVLLTDPVATGLSCTTLTCAVTAGTAGCPALSISTLQSPGLVITPTFNAGSTLSFVLTCNVTATGR